jgi:cephalosporin hydroxylase
LIGSNQGEVIDSFHRLYYDRRVWKDTFWLGVPALKCPLDLWVYQELMFEVKPSVIVECGTYDGGSAAFLASICDLLKRGRIITIDIELREGRPKHRRVKYFLGSSTAPETVDFVRREIRPRDTVLVILDSDHRRDHVLEEMRLYAPLVTAGSYLIVEDTNINGNPVYPAFGPGPMEAVQEFLSDRHDFEVDRSREKFFVTFNPGGWLRRVAPSSP